MENLSSLDISGFTYNQMLALWNSGEQGHNKLRELLPNLPVGFISIQALYDSYQEVKGFRESQNPLQENETQETNQFQEPLREADSEAMAA